MQFSTVLVAALTSALASAVPTAKISSSSCAVQYPTAVDFKAVDFPISLSLAKNAAVDITADLSFEIPPAAVGPCSLVVELPANYPILTSGDSQVNVKAVNGPAPGALVGTYTFVQSPDAIFVTIDSFACRPTFEFVLEIAGAEGALSLTEIEGAGIFMTYDC